MESCIKILFSDANFSRIFNKRKPTTDHWMDFSIGSSACHIAVSQIQKRKAVDVELYINDDKELFKSLFAHKDEIEKNMEMELEWKELPERKASRILISVQTDVTRETDCKNLIEKTVDLDDRATWPEQFDYIMDTCIKMKRAFKRYL